MKVIVQCLDKVLVETAGGQMWAFSFRFIAANDYNGRATVHHDGWGKFKIYHEDALAFVPGAEYSMEMKKLK